MYWISTSPGFGNEIRSFEHAAHIEHRRLGDGSLKNFEVSVEFGSVNLDRPHSFPIPAGDANGKQLPKKGKANFEERKRSRESEKQVGSGNQLGKGGNQVFESGNQLKKSHYEIGKKAIKLKRAATELKRTKTKLRKAATNFSTAKTNFSRAQTNFRECERAFHNQQPTLERRNRCRAFLDQGASRYYQVSFACPEGAWS